MADLLSKETVCVSAVADATARARTAKILYNKFMVRRFDGSRSRQRSSGQQGLALFAKTC